MRSPVLIESIIWARSETANPQGFFHPQVKPEFVFVFAIGGGQDFGFPVEGNITMLAVLGEARVGPLSGLSCLPMFHGPCFKAAGSFSYVDGARFALALEFVDALPFHRARAGFVLPTENVLEFVARSEKRVAAALLKALFG